MQYWREGVTLSRQQPLNGKGTLPFIITINCLRIFSYNIDTYNKSTIVFFISFKVGKIYLYTVTYHGCSHMVGGSFVWSSILRNSY